MERIVFALALLLTAGDLPAAKPCPGGRCAAPAYYPAVALAAPPKPEGEGWRWDAARRHWWKPSDPAPAPEAEAPKAADEFPDGVIRDAERLPSGFHGPRPQAGPKLYGDELPPDDSAWPRVTVIADGFESAITAVKAQVAGAKALVQGFKPSDWQVAGVGFKVPASGQVVYVQKADGTVTLRTDDPASPAIVSAVRKAQPDYDPAKDPDGKPKPEPKPDPKPDAAPAPAPFPWEKFAPYLTLGAVTVLLLVFARRN